MPLECVEYVQQTDGEYRTLRLYGQEKNLTSSSIARMNIFLHGIEGFDIANPPFSLKKWAAEEWANDPYGRNFAGTPPKGNADMAWVQHMIASMKPEIGRMVVVLPHGALFRKGADGRIRKATLQQDVLEAVIGLGPNIFYGTPPAPCVLVFKQQKPTGLREKVLFIDASD